MKVHIRFLRQGLVEAETPKDFESWSKRQKMEWANEHLAQLPDAELLKAMAEWGDAEIPEIHDCFAGGPSASAIEVGEGKEVGTPLVQTREWEFFASAAGLTLEED